MRIVDLTRIDPAAVYSLGRGGPFRFICTTEPGWLRGYVAVEVIRGTLGWRAWCDVKFFDGHTQRVALKRYSFDEPWKIDGRGVLIAENVYAAPITVFKKAYEGFEDCSDIFRDVSEAFNARFNPTMKKIPGEFQGRMTVTITFEAAPEDLRGNSVPIAP